jgi:O-antigen/teichoic acid export membrane protein
MKPLRALAIAPFRSDSLRGVAILFGGSVASQAIASVANIVLARYFDPGEFGVLGLYVTISGFLVVVASARLDLAIMLPRSRAIANDLTLVSMGFALFSGFILFIAALLWRQDVAMALRAPELSRWLLVLPLSVALGGVAQAAHAWLARNKRYQDLSRSRTLQSGSSALAQWAGRHWHPAGGLVMGTLAGQAIGCAGALHASTRKTTARLRWRMRGRIGSYLRRFRDFPLHSLPDAAVGQCQPLLTSVMIAKFWSVEANGQLLLAQRLLYLPLALVTQAVGNVIFQRLAERRGAGAPIGPSLLRAWRVLALLATVIVGGAYVFAEPAARLVLGERWASSGSMMHALLPQLFFLIILGPTSTIAVVMRRQHVALWAGVAGLIAKFLWLHHCAQTASEPSSAVLGVSILDAAQMVALNAAIWWAIKREASQPC